MSPKSYVSRPIVINCSSFQALKLASKPDRQTDSHLGFWEMFQVTPRRHILILCCPMSLIKLAFNLIS